MHEISLIENIIEIIMAEMPKHSVTKVETITLRIGEMRHIVSDTLVFGFDVLSKDTPLEGAKLIIESVPMRGRCKTCGQDFIIEDWFSNCSKCDGTNTEIISGKELEIVAFEGS